MPVTQKPYITAFFNSTAIPVYTSYLHSAVQYELINKLALNNRPVSDADKQNDVDNSIRHDSFCYSVSRGRFPVGTGILYPGLAVAMLMVN